MLSPYCQCTTLLIDIPNSRGLVFGETRSQYLIANVLRLFSTEFFSIGFDIYRVYTRCSRTTSRSN